MSDIELPRHGSMAQHSSPRMETDEWLTPPDIKLPLGVFDLDPCAPTPDRRPWDTALQHFSVLDNGLAQPWRGRVWLNPPYGRDVADWLGRMCAHGNGIAIIFARTDTVWWHRTIPTTDAVLYLAGRIKFCRVDGSQADNNGGAPSALLAWGAPNVTALELSGLKGILCRSRGMSIFA